MTESSAPLTWQSPLDTLFKSDSGPAAWFILALGFLLRLGKASGTFLNFDEAMHALAASRPALGEAYRGSLTLAHPPLLILLLHFWGKLSTAEWFLRLPSVIAGTIVCWIFFRWLTRLLGPAVGWVGFLLVSLLPMFVELSSEIRQYALLLCFMMAAAYLLELALYQDSAGKMAACFLFLFLAMLTHFSAILFAGALGVYSLWRLASVSPSRPLLAVWIAGQAGALGLFVFLYAVQISKLKADASTLPLQGYLAGSYFHPGHGHLPVFLFARTFGVLQYTFGQLAVGDIAGLLFVAGVVVLLARKEVTPTGSDTARRRRPSFRQIALLLSMPFLINAVAAVAGLYPYGGTRHSAFLAPFAIAAVSLTITMLSRRPATAAGIAVLIVAACQAFGAPHRPYMRREDQQRGNMTHAMDTIRQAVSPDDLIFTDFQTNFLLRFYLCPEVTPDALPDSNFRTYTCAGHRVLSTGSETNLLTADLFLSCWDGMVSAGGLKPGRTVWTFQAGWDIDLARELQERIPRFRGLQAQSFGHNISLFKLSVGQGMQPEE